MVILIAPVAIFIFGSVIMLLWNNVLTPVLHVSPLHSGKPSEYWYCPKYYSAALMEEATGHADFTGEKK